MRMSLFTIALSNYVRSLLLCPSTPIVLATWPNAPAPVHANLQPDSQSNSTLLPLTPRILPILAEVLAPEPEDQLPNEETREKIVQLVRYIAGKGEQGRREVAKYEGLAALL